MFYQAELDFLKRIYSKYRLNVITLSAGRATGQDSMLQTISEYISKVEPNTIYRFTDSLACSYICLLLPGSSEKNILLVGPYIANDITARDEANSHYPDIPFISDDSHVLTALYAFAEIIWDGSSNFTVHNIEYGSPSEIALHLDEEAPSKINKAIWNMERMEERYSYENDLMEAIVHGQEYKANVMFSSFKTPPFEKRSSDSLRNVKNYLVIMNTLCRKAAEHGGVHPLYINEISGDYAVKIEHLTDFSNLQEFMRSMFKSYCRLVRKHSFKDCSPLIKKVLIYIDTDLTADLSLNALAKVSGVNPSYLSSQFHHEAGRTVTDYVNEKRIRHATYLLENTSFQIQAVAQNCGFMDVHYFSKVFKKYMGKTPKEYRSSRRKN